MVTKLEIKDAMDTLRALAGARDAFLGFSQVIEKIQPLITNVAELESDVARLTKERDALAKENATFRTLQVEHDVRKANLEAEFAKHEELIMKERREMLDAQDKLRIGLTAAEVNFTNRSRVLETEIHEREEVLAKLSAEVARVRKLTDAYVEYQKG